ncbi:MAG TPA: GNAT family N-acetyltransferase [Dehalococcoidia bacterium]|nr:GNAT family N-acetyltransferase [Dehalococcoidia bacterium]
MTGEDQTALALAVMAYVRSVASPRSQILREEPFTLVLSKANKTLHFNYALPDDGAAPGTAAIEALVAQFAERGVQPHVESVREAAPKLAATLETHGFRVEMALPLMVCMPDALVPLPVPDGVELRQPSTDAELMAMATLQHRVFGEPEPPGAADLQRGRWALNAGGVLLTALDGSTVVGAGMAAPSHAGTREIVGVGVAESHRRRGIAGAIVAALAARAFATGDASVFLEAERGAGGAYERAGFATRLEVMHHVR